MVCILAKLFFHLLSLKWLKKYWTDTIWKDWQVQGPKPTNGFNVMFMCLLENQRSFGWTWRHLCCSAMMLRTMLRYSWQGLTKPHHKLSFRHFYYTVLYAYLYITILSIPRGPKLVLIADATAETRKHIMKLYKASNTYIYFWYLLLNIDENSPPQVVLFKNSQLQKQMMHIQINLSSGQTIPGFKVYFYTDYLMQQFNIRLSK